MKFRIEAALTNDFSNWKEKEMRLLLIVRCAHVLYLINV